jgi:hypothetical protein
MATMVREAGTAEELSQAVMGGRARHRQLGLGEAQH